MDARIPSREVKTVTGLTPAALAEWVTALGPQAGTLQVTSPYHCWQLLLVGEGLLLAENGDRPLNPFLRKAKAVRPPLSHLPELERLAATEGVGRLTLYRGIGGESFTEGTRQALQQTLYETLLALVLDSELAVRWYPDPAIAALALPRWRFGTLYTGLLPEVQRWRGLTYVRHPYQRVQLLDSDDTMAQVPLFASVTSGRHPIVEIADRFQQDVFRTALKLDKLAEKRTVAILPLIPLPAAVPAPVPAASAPTVCVVDDSPVLLQQFAALLQEWGYSPLIIDDPRTAIAAMVAAHPAVVFLDINMPEYSGFDLIAQIRRQSEIAKVPIVLVTSESNIANSLRAKWANSRFLAKPRSAAEVYTFRDALRRCLREVAPLPSDLLI